MFIFIPELLLKILAGLWIFGSILRVLVFVMERSIARQNKKRQERQTEQIRDAVKRHILRQNIRNGFGDF